jgi:hypothetical protein
MSDLSIRFDQTTNNWQFVADNGAATNFTAATDAQPFVAKSLSSRASNFDVAVSGCTQTPTVKLAVLGPSIPITWVPSDGSEITVAVIATCGAIKQSGYVKVKKSSG